MNVCVPGKYDSVNKTCFSIEQLTEMVKAYNRFITKTKFSPDKTMEIGGADLIKIKPDKKYLLEQLRDRFENVCHGDEVCITKQSFMNELVKEMYEDIMEETFRAPGPEKAEEWLSTMDINKIMEPYEKIYRNFKFLGAVPLDCSEYRFCSLHGIDFNEYLQNGIRYLGIVFNHDKFGQPGSHWVSLFVDIEAGEIYYCDSTGNKPLADTNKFINQFKEYYKKIKNKQAIYKQNNNQYQKDASECGIYSCNFIIRKLAGETFEEIVDNPLNFKQINSCRNVYFRNKPSKYDPHPKCDPTNQAA